LIWRTDDRRPESEVGKQKKEGKTVVGNQKLEERKQEQNDDEINIKKI